MSSAGRLYAIRTVETQIPLNLGGGRGGLSSQPPADLHNQGKPGKGLREAEARTQLKDVCVTNVVSASAAVRAPAPPAGVLPAAQALFEGSGPAAAPQPLGPAERLTERLWLRAPQADDLAALYEFHADPATHRYNPAGCLLEPAAMKAELERWLLHWQHHGFGYWMVCHRDRPAQVLGVGGVMRKRIDDRQAMNLHFRFRTQAWGQGYAAETSCAALTLAFEQLHEAEVLSVVRPANQPARRTLERAGLRLIGAWGDVPGQPASLIYEMNEICYREQREAGACCTNPVAGDR